MATKSDIGKSVHQSTEKKNFVLSDTEQEERQQEPAEGSRDTEDLAEKTYIVRNKKNGVTYAKPKQH